MRTLLVPALVLLTLTVLLIVKGAGPDHGEASPPVTIGVDAITTGNSATALGSIDTCGELAGPASTRTVDVYIQDAVNLGNWGVTFLYDNTKLKVTGAEIDGMFLGSFPSVFIISNPVPDIDGGFDMLVTFGTGFTPKSGEGVLARLTLEAVDNGTSPLSLLNDEPDDIYLRGGTVPPYAEPVFLAPGSPTAAEIVAGDICVGANNPPTADAKNLDADQDTPLDITLTATDPDGDCPLTFAIVPASGPTNGSLGSVATTGCTGGSATGSVTYTPNSGYSGPDSFQYTASDPSAATSAPATVSITVIADADGDGVPDASDNCPAWPNTDQSLPPWSVTLDGSDPDCDGFSTTDETAISTNPLMACGAGAWPPDITDNQAVDFLDLNAIVPFLFQPVAGNERYNLRVDGAIDFLDLNAEVPFLFQGCTLP